MLRVHVSFEINRFRLAASMWGGPVRYGDTVDAMMRESCLIHMRLLLDFFYPRIKPESSKFGDVFVSDYLLERNKMPQALQVLLIEPRWLQHYRDQLDWRLAHLTTKRIDSEQQVWRPQEQLKHLELLISEFLNALSPSTLALFDPNRQ